jgi:hypothetical protein
MVIKVEVSGSKDGPIDTTNITPEKAFQKFKEYDTKTSTSGMLEPLDC